MKHSAFAVSTPELGELFAQAWLPEEKPEAVFAFLHGISEHSSRYAHVAEWFVERGYAFAAYDQYGHGRSPGKRGDIPGYAAVMDGIDRFLQAASAVASGVPVFLYGHSLGGNYALHYALLGKPVSVAGVIATSPWLRLAFEPPGWKLALARLFAELWPSLTQRNGLDPAALTRDGTAKPADSLGHDRISVRLFNAVRDSGERILRLAEESPAAVRQPLLLMHGTEDAITSCRSTRQLATALNGDVTYLEWEGFRHELHNEPPPERELVLQAILDWAERIRRERHAGFAGSE